MYNIVNDLKCFYKRIVTLKNVLYYIKHEWYKTISYVNILHPYQFGH